MEIKKQSNVIYLIFGILLLHQNFCDCSLFWGNGRNPRDPTRCYLGRGADALIIEIGETERLPKACCEAYCQKDLMIKGTCCGAVSGPPGCKVSEPDLSLPFPDCCPTLVCQGYPRK